MDITQLLVAEFVLFGVIITAIATIAVVVAKELFDRLENLEKDNRRLNELNLNLYYWTRRHIDLYYRYRREGAPDPEPLDWLEKEK